MLRVSHVVGSMYAKKSSTKSVPIGDWSKGSTIGWYFGIVQGSDKISYTCNPCSWLADFWEWWPKIHLVGSIYNPKLRDMIDDWWGLTVL